MKEQEIKQDAKKWIIGWLHQFSLDSLEHIVLSDENRQSIEKNIAILHEMIDFCLERNYRQIIMMLPVTKELSNLFPETFKKEHIMENIKKANIQNVPLLNYLTDDRFIMPGLYFNSFFLNTKGREIFTKTVVEEIKTLW
jgi:hypothetical protein